MSLIPITRYRLHRTSDGQGGFTTTVLNSVDLFGVIRMKDETETLAIDRHEDVTVEDVIRAADEMDGFAAFYRVASIQQEPGARLRVLMIQKIEKPLWPLDLNYLYYSGDQLFFNGSPLYV